MNRAIVIAGSFAAACAAGIALGRFTCHSIACRDALGGLCGRGHILAITQGKGIYEKDLESEIDHWEYTRGQENVDPVNPDTKRAALSRLVITATVLQLARTETVSSDQIDRAVERVRDQFRDGTTWDSALRSNHLSIRLLRSKAAAARRAEKWLEHELENVRKTSNGERRQYFDAHRQAFVLPERLRASHLFLAAPAETPAPVVDLKRRTIDSVSVRLNHGENFSDLVRTTSEDEASKVRAGDVGFFSASRMPADFFSAVEKMQIGTASPPIQTGLGFHIVQLNDRRAARQMSFEEAEAEILLKLENAKRVEAANRLAEKWLAEVSYLRAEL